VHNLIRKALALSAATVAAVGVAACSGGQGGADTQIPSLADGAPSTEQLDAPIDTSEVKKSLVVGVDNSHYIFHTDVVVARELGYFKEFGIDSVEVKTIDDPIPGLIGNSLDFINYDIDNIVASAAKSNTELRVLAVTFGEEVATLGVRSGINSAEDLKGATLSPGQFNSRHERNLRELLESNGLDPDSDVKLVETGGNTNERLQNIIGGVIDGGTVQPRHRSFLEASGGKFLFQVRRQVPQTGWAAGRILVDSPETAPAFLAAVLKARQFTTDFANKERVLQIMADNGFDIPQEYKDAFEEENAPTYHTIDGGFSVEDMDKFIEDAKDFDIMPADVDWKRWTDLIPLWRAQKAVGMELRPSPSQFTAQQ